MVQCGFEYDEAKGWPEDGIAPPGTGGDDIPRTELPGLRRGQVGLRDGGSRPAVTVTVARVTRPRFPIPRASRALLRDTVLDAMRDELLAKDWSAVTLSDVARTAGISRQTIYNEFGSPAGLAQAYAMRLADRLVGAVAGPSTPTSATSTPLSWGFRPSSPTRRPDPLVISLLSGEAKPDLLQLITTDSGPIITHCSTRLTEKRSSTVGSAPPRRTPACWPAPSSGWR